MIRDVSIPHFLAIASGGAIGAVARYSLSTGVSRLTGSMFPWGTFAVNVLGCCILGFLFGLTGHPLLSRNTRGFLAVGFTGAFTTFSTFALEAVTLMERREYLAAAGYAGGSLTAGIVSCLLGIAAARALLETIT